MHWTALALLVLLWYTTSIAYSMLAKLGMQVAPDASPLLLTFLQCLCGVVAAIVGSRGNIAGLRQLLVTGGPLMALIGLAHFVGSYLTAASMGLGSVAITYVIKATEPLFAVALSMVFMRAKYSTQTLLSLVPLSIGLVLAVYRPSPSEPAAESAGPSGSGEAIISLGAIAALAANVGMASRNVLGKVRMTIAQLTGSSTPPGGAKPREEERGPRGKKARPDMGPIVVFGVMSIWGGAFALGMILLDMGASETLISLPMRLMQGESSSVFLVSSATSHAVYTICSFIVLQSVHPASHAIITGMKHVFVIVAAALLLGNPLSAMQALGGVVAMTGVFAYNRSMSAAKTSASGSDRGSPAAAATAGATPPEADDTKDPEAPQVEAKSATSQQFPWWLFDWRTVAGIASTVLLALAVADVNRSG